MYICMYAYSSRRDKLICTKRGMLIPWDQEENIGKSELRKAVMCSIPGEDGSCCLETKNDRTTAPRPK
jgi:hypothetical protein